MKINFNYYFFFVFFLFESCSDIYSPISPNFQTFDSTLTVFGEGALSLTGLEYKTAINPINHICLQFNGQLGTFAENNSYYYNEGAIGIYNVLSNSFYNQILFGYGEGKSEFADQYTGLSQLLTSSKGYYNKVFGLINFTFNKNKKIVQGICIRIADIKYTYTESNFHWLTDKIHEIYYLEPYYLLQINADKNVSYKFYSGFAFKSEPNDVIRTSPVYFGVGISIKFYERKK